MTDSSMNDKTRAAIWYAENGGITDCVLDTKDAFWHSKNVTVRDSIVKGHILSVKNLRSGHVIADSVGEIICGDTVMECAGEMRRKCNRRSLFSASEFGNGI